jgi:hypothetical protein
LYLLVDVFLVSDDNLGKHRRFKQQWLLRLALHTEPDVFGLTDCIFQSLHSCCSRSLLCCSRLVGSMSRLLCCRLLFRALPFGLYRLLFRALPFGLCRLLIRELSFGLCRLLFRALPVSDPESERSET